MTFIYEEYTRSSKLPHILCPGCHDGIIMKSMLRAIHEIGWKKDDVVMVSGIGCCSRIPGYCDFNTLHTTHGRSLAFATGVKLAKPHLKIIAISGDGDCAAIGGNHFIHACRRNMDMTLIIFNNFIYGMTGGQCSPTTPEDDWSSTTPYGNIDPPFDLSELAIAAGASYVARCTAYQATLAQKLILDGLKTNGFSVIEVFVGCPTCYGRKNKYKSAVDLLNFFKDVSIPISRTRDMKKEEVEGKIVIGLLHKKERPSYLEKYQKVIDKAQKKI